MILAAVLQGITAFAATNIDDIFVLMMFFGQMNSDLRPRHIVIGQYLGFGALIALSVLGFFGTLVIPQEWVGLLGFLPIALGLRQLWQLRKTPESASPGAEQFSVKVLEEKDTTPSRFLNGQILGVAAVTFANGGDNIAIYVPLFASAGLNQMAIIIVVFFIMVALWCYLAYRLVKLPMITRVLARYGHLFMPFVLIGLGIFILVESSTLTLLK